VTRYKIATESGFLSLILNVTTSTIVRVTWDITTIQWNPREPRCQEIHSLANPRSHRYQSHLDPADGLQSVDQYYEGVVQAIVDIVRRYTTRCQFL